MTSAGTSFMIGIPVDDSMDAGVKRGGCGATMFALSPRNAAACLAREDAEVVVGRAIYAVAL